MQFFPIVVDGSLATKRKIADDASLNDSGTAEKKQVRLSAYLIS
jgi:hypothetical protein